jgi:hypothetical protein
MNVTYCTYQIWTNQTIHIPTIYGMHTVIQITTQPFSNVLRKVQKHIHLLEAE